MRSGDNIVLTFNVKWNEENKYGLPLSPLAEYETCAPRIRFMRLSSEMFPFASHGKYGYSLDYAAADLKVGVSCCANYLILTPL